MLFRSPIPGTLQARTLGWVAISFSNAGKRKVKGKFAQLCPTLRDPMDCSPSGSSVHGIFQARVLEWGAIAFYYICVYRNCQIIRYNHVFRRRQWHPTPVLLPGKSHGRRSLVGCRPWGREESDTTERLHFHFSLSCSGKEGNGNPHKCSCLENPRNGGAGWAAVYGLAQSWTQLKRLSSSSNKLMGEMYGN